MIFPLDYSFIMKRQCDLVTDVVQDVCGDALGRCLEIGCANGDAFQYLARNFSLVVGVDISLDKLLSASSNIPERTNVVLTGCRKEGKVDYPFAASFKTIVAFSLLHHLDNREMVQVLREALRMLLPGGVLIILEYNPLNPLSLLTVTFGREDKGSRALFKREVRSLFTKCDIEIVDDGYLLFFPRSLSFLTTWEKKMRQLPFGGKYFVAGMKA